MPHASSVSAGQIHSLTHRSVCRPMVLALAMMLALSLAAGCQKTKVDARPLAVAPPPTFVGPEFLHGTVGSMTTYRGTEDLIVSGYGIVVNLDGTGSSEVPPQLRQRLLTELRKRRIANASAILNDKRTSVVAIQGLIPPGALRGTRFDVLVSALPQTQTTSLTGGDLWESELGIGGTVQASTYVKTRAAARGPIYINPMSDNVLNVDRDAVLRQGIVLGGGAATEERRIEIALRQPSWTQSRRIADRINMRFAHENATDVFNTAMPETDEIIKLNIPERFRHRRNEFLGLVAHTFVQSAVDFEPAKAAQLGRELERSPQFASSIEQAWFTLGRTALPTIREYYGHEKMYVRLAALAAGAKLEDGRTVEWLTQLAKSPDVNLRRRAAELLVELPRSLLAVKSLHELLDDEDTTVRIVAYESLARVSDPILGRVAITNGRDLKFVLDLVPSKHSLIYATHSMMPRLVIFNPMAGFRPNVVGSLMGNRLMVRSSGIHDMATVYYQAPHKVTGETIDIAPTIANLVRLMGHKTTSRNPERGLDMSYSEVLGALYQLKQQGFIEADLEIRLNGLARTIAKAQETASVRPEIAEVQPTLSDEEYIPPADDQPELLSVPEAALNPGGAMNEGDDMVDGAGTSEPDLVEPELLVMPEAEVEPEPAIRDNSGPEPPSDGIDFSSGLD